MIKLIIYTKPFGKQSVRFSSTKNGQKAYLPKETKETQEYIGWIAKIYMQRNKLQPLGEAIVFRLYIFIKNDKKTQPASSKLPVYCTSKPDCSNVLKLVEDALQGICFLNDKQIVDVRVKKFYGTKDKMIIIIKSVNE